MADAAAKLYVWDCAVAFMTAQKDGGVYAAPLQYDVSDLIGGEYVAPGGGGATANDSACVKFYQARATVARREEEVQLLRNEATRYFAYQDKCLKLVTSEIQSLTRLAEIVGDVEPPAAAADHQEEPGSPAAPPPPLQLLPPPQPPLPSPPPSPPPSPLELASVLPASVRILLAPSNTDAADDTLSPGVVNLCRAVAHARALELERYCDTTREQIAEAERVWVRKGLPAQGRRPHPLPPMGDVLPAWWATRDAAPAVDGDAGMAEAAEGGGGGGGEEAAGVGAEAEMEEELEEEAAEMEEDPMAEEFTPAALQAVWLEAQRPYFPDGGAPRAPAAGPLDYGEL